jgi:hypothetical protein
MTRVFRILTLIGLLPLTALGSVNRLQAEKVVQVQAKKTGQYLRDGMFVGGDRSIDDVVVMEIRYASNPAGYERIVLDLEANRSGEPTAISRPPYYQVSASPELKRIEISVFGKPKLGFDPKKVHRAFKKSSLIERVELLPPVERDRWTFVLNLAQDASVEVFELGNPVRVIVDLKKR